MNLSPLRNPPAGLNGIRGIMGSTIMSTDVEEDRQSRLKNLKDFYIRQFVSLLWMLAAIAVGLLLREQIPWLKQNVEYPLMLLLSGGVGILLSNTSQFRKAGAVITRVENPRLNILIGFAIVVALLLLLNAVMSLVLQ
jgi:uncharacterized membrane protein YbjE (DUF340 family)